MVWLAENQPLPRQMKQFSEAVAPWMYVAVQRLQPSGVGGEAAKRQAGAQMGRLKPMETALKGWYNAPPGTPSFTVSFIAS